MEGGIPGLPNSGASGESVASASSFCDYCQGTIHQRRPGRAAQTARRPPGSLQIALAWGEGALRHRLPGERRVGHSGEWIGRGRGLWYGGRATAGAGQRLLEEPSPSYNLWVLALQ